MENQVPIINDEDEFSQALLWWVGQVPNPPRVKLEKPVVRRGAGGKKITVTHMLRKRIAIPIEGVMSAYVRHQYPKTDLKFLPLSLPGRNQPCPCDSGKKFKKCCADQFEPQHARLVHR